MHDSHLQNLYNQDFYTQITEASLLSAALVVPLVQNLFQAKSVQDFGCGTGGWLAEFKKHGASTILGYDANKIDLSLLHLPKKNIMQGCNFTSPSFAPKMRSDLAISMEVAEHLPASAAAHFIKTLTEAAPCVLFSAALPGQGGTEHANEQHPAYWRNLFAACGYATFDPIRPAIYTNKDICWWYKQNIFVYIDFNYLKQNPALFTRLLPHAVNLEEPDVMGFVSEWNLYNLCASHQALYKVMDFLQNAPPDTPASVLLQKIKDEIPLNYPK